ncbi:MAG: tripartite tricarboxylate transporter substrate binding protein [Gemmataceae bacterium]
MMRLVGISCFVVMLCGCRQQETQDNTYPSKAIKVIVPFNPGGETDTFARIIERGIKDNELLDVPLVIVNKPGAAATVGSRYVKDAKPDGYTVLLLHDALFTAQRAQQVKYGSTAFEPVAGTGETGSVIAVHKDSRFETLKDLTNEIQDSPRTVVFGVNVAAVSHFGGLRLERAVDPEQAKREGLFRYTQSGSGNDRCQKLLGKHIDLTLFSTGEFIRFQSRGIRGLAVLGNERETKFKDIPTAKEQGYDVVMRNMQYWWFPKRTPKDRVEYFADVLTEAMKTEHVQKKLLTLDCDPIVLRGDELHKRIHQRVNDFQSVTFRPLFPLPNIPLYIFVLAVVLVVLFSVSRRTKSATSQSDNTAAKENRSKITFSSPTTLVGLTLIWMVGYILCLQYGLLPFRYATSAFTLITGISLARFRLRAIPFIVGSALLLSFGLDYLIHNIVFVDLP